MNRSIAEAFVQLRYKNPTEDQNKAIFEFVKGRDVFVSFLLEKASLCAGYASLSVVFDNLREDHRLGDVMESLYACRPCFSSWKRVPT